jgi:hypothetical protein
LFSSASGHSKERNGFTVNAWIWGALDEPIPANDNELIERAVA